MGSVTVLRRARSLESPPDSSSLLLPNRPVPGGYYARDPEVAASILRQMRELNMSLSQPYLAPRPPSDPESDDDAPRDNAERRTFRPVFSRPTFSPYRYRRGSRLSRRGMRHLHVTPACFDCFSSPSSDSSRTDGPPPDAVLTDSTDSAPEEHVEGAADGSPAGTQPANEETPIEGKEKANEPMN
ncbi:unnamed protein product [Heligmosomoides polygyrus]|uniref:ORF2 n=1 Tax=Heligmosomoides polygyrus TaxID=6339 RepID=A0A183FHX9_HELPZ|nr:unnamed protein product [Heligmosomoides polygyrus]